MGEVLQNKRSYDDLDDSGRSVISLHIHIAAAHILTFKTKDDRRVELLKMPESVRPLIELEVIKQWNNRTRHL